MILGAILGSAHAQVHWQMPGNTPPIDPTLLSPPTPQWPDPDSQALENAVEKLRKTAQAPRGRTGIKGEPTPSEAAWLLGLLALHGKAMQADPVQARHWFERAYLLGNPVSSAGLAWCHIDGCGRSPDPALARTWIDRVRKVMPGRALYLEWYLESQLAPLEITPPAPTQEGAPPVPARHHNLLLQAAQTGDSQALNELGLENLTAGRLGLALRQFQAAGKRSDAAAQNARLLTQRMNAKAPASGERQTDASQWFLQAQKYHRGDGVPANYAEAIRLYQMAAAGGNTDARRMLELIYSRPAPQGVIDIAWMQQLATLDLTREGAILSAHGPSGQSMFGRDPTPLYDLLPSHWRNTLHSAHR